MEAITRDNYTQVFNCLANGQRCELNFGHNHLIDSRNLESLIENKTSALIVSLFLHCEQFVL